MSKTAGTPAKDLNTSPRPGKRLPPSSSDNIAELPQNLHPRRPLHSWFAFRLFLGCFGAGLVLLPLAVPQSWIASIIGLAIFLTAILLPPHSKRESQPPRSRPISAQIVLTGAEYCSVDAISIPVRLFVDSKQVLALKPDLQPAAVVPLASLSAVFLQRIEHSWLLILQSALGETVFSFRGVFAERNARRADSAVRGFVRDLPPDKPKARAASA